MTKQLRLTGVERVLDPGVEAIASFVELGDGSESHMAVAVDGLLRSLGIPVGRHTEMVHDRIRAAEASMDPETAELFRARVSALGAAVAIVAERLRSINAPSLEIVPDLGEEPDSVVIGRVDRPFPERESEEPEHLQIAAALSRLLPMDDEATMAVLGDFLDSGSSAPMNSDKEEAAIQVRSFLIEEFGQNFDVQSAGLTPRETGAVRALFGIFWEARGAVLKPPVQLRDMLSNLSQLPRQIKQRATLDGLTKLIEAIDRKRLASEADGSSDG